MVIKNENTIFQNEMLKVNTEISQVTRLTLKLIPISRPQSKSTHRVFLIDN